MAGALGVRVEAYCVLCDPRSHQLIHSGPRELQQLQGWSLPFFQELASFMIFTSPSGVQTANYRR